MNTNKLNIRFVISSSRIRKDKRASLMCRLTYLKKRKQFATGKFINPDHWNSKQQLVKPPEPDAELINTQLSLIKTKLSQAFLMLQVKEESFTVEDIYLQYKGEKAQKEQGTLEAFKRYLESLKKLIGIDIQRATWIKFDYAYKHVKAFIKHKFKRNDYPLNKLKLQFLADFEYYLKTEKGLGQATINKMIQRFRKPIRIAVAEGNLDKDPFMLYKAKRTKNSIVFLSPEELNKLENHEFSQPRLKFVKDLFIFCCYTGLPYNELMRLESKHIIKGFDGNLWIKIYRMKTSKPLSIPLLPKALEIMERYNQEGFVFPRITNQKYNSYLKEIGAITGIDKKFTTHMARRTFASTILLYNNVPMEIVSELLGHSSIKVTQDSYGKVVEKRISMEMENLNKDLK
ncbi:site-specific integrase [Seonamhaeicola sediminis]|uniref:Site-specific integrase n=1 Tax=Seonamhaeicola sediminis TaxID=2528206 RepID=A0A562YBR0_9FLAO|nr:site-specific integrase [Seonamhaeicola sediminis]TWO31515.1 site-specific integrase [Seonamhaeicola sediminis]